MRAVKDYCCCAIPLNNAGIYLTLITNIVLAITAGTLAIATPSIVGASTPSFAPWIVAILCYVAAGIEVLGLIGVARDKTILYRRFTTLHCLIIIGIFAVTGVFIGWSGAKHNTAQSKCENDFFSNTPTTTAPSSSPLNTDGEASLLCNIFSWATFGIMAGLWAILGLFEFYLYLVISGYGSSQRDDHAQYFALYNVNDGPAPNTMLLPSNTEKVESWPRTSMDNVNTFAVGSHYRADSDATVHEKDYSDYPQAYEKTNPYSNPSRSNTQRSTVTRQYSSPRRQLSQPSNAYTQDPGPTPTYNDPYYGWNGGVAQNPYPSSQPHPAEGSFRRKTPRIHPGMGPGYRQRTPTYPTEY